MIRDITLGQYYMANSPIHRMDPRTKIGGTFIFIISLFVAKNIPGYLLGALFLCFCIKICQVPVRFMLRGMKSIAVLLLFTVVLNLFLTPGDIILVSFWKIKISQEGLIIASQMAARLTFLIIGSSIMTLTTTPNNLTDGMEKVMRPLKLFGIPVHEVAMMMSIALRFIPILLEETDKIMKAQMARGANFENGNIVKRAKALVPVLVPLFVSAFKRAEDLAQAMEARCYNGGDNRSKMKPLKYKTVDIIAYLILFTYIGAAITLRVLL